MGKDKAFLQLQGRTLLARALERVAAVSGVVHIVGEPQKFSTHGGVVQDVYPDRGPLAGIHAALLQSRTDLNLMLAVDLPFMESAFLRYLIDCASQTKALVTVPRIDGRWHSLCAIYRREFAPVAEQSLRRGENKINALLSQVETRVIGEEELLREGFSAGMFRNLNTPAEWQAAQIEIGRKPAEKH